MSRAQRGRKEPVAKALDAEQRGTSAASSPNPPGGRGPACMSYGRSHLTQPQSCVTRSPFLGGVPCVPSLELMVGRAQLHSQSPGQWAGVRASPSPRSHLRAAWAGSQLGATATLSRPALLRPAPPGPVTGLLAAGTDTCHRRGCPDVTLHHQMPLFPPGPIEGW